MKQMLNSNAVRVLSFLVIAIAASPQMLLAQCASSYSDATADESGNVYAWSVLDDDYTATYTGCTPGGWGYFTHTYYSSVTISSPSNRTATGTGGGSMTPGSAGSSRADAVIGLGGEFGDFTITDFQRIDCSVAGPSFVTISSPALIATVSNRQFTYSFDSFDYFDSNYGNYRRCNVGSPAPSGTLCLNIRAHTSEFGGTLPAYAVFQFTVVRLPLVSVCLKVNRGRQNSCIPDPQP